MRKLTRPEIAETFSRFFRFPVLPSKRQPLQFARGWNIEVKHEPLLRFVLHARYNHSQFQLKLDNPFPTGADRHH